MFTAKSQPDMFPPLELYNDHGLCSDLAEGSVSPSWAAQQEFVLVDDDGEDNLYMDPSVDRVPSKHISPEQEDSPNLCFMD